MPKRIFFYWGNETMSWLRYMTLKSCRYYNPDWEIILYHCPCRVKKETWEEYNKQDFANFSGEDYFSKVSDLGIQIKHWDIPIQKLKGIAASHKSNFFKWYMLATEGGIYADMDILFIKSLDSLYEEIKETHIGLCIHDWLSIGFLHSNSISSFFVDVFHTAVKTYTPEHYQCVGVQAVYTLVDNKKRNTKKIKENLKKILKTNYPGTQIYNYDMSLFYHYDFKNLGNLFLKTQKMPEQSIGIHWYAGAPIAQKWNNGLTESNFTEYTNTITKYARECYV